MTQEHWEGQEKRQTGDTSIFPCFKHDHSDSQIKHLENESHKPV